MRIIIIEPDPEFDFESFKKEWLEYDGREILRTEDDEEGYDTN